MSTCLQDITGRRVSGGHDILSVGDKMNSTLIGVLCYPNSVPPRALVLRPNARFCIENWEPSKAKTALQKTFYNLWIVQRVPL